MNLVSILVPAAIILVAMAVLNIPLYLAILAATLYIAVFAIRIPVESIFTGIFDNVAKTSFLCIPFFVLTGTLIQASTLGSRLINLFMVVLRSTKAGLAIACLFSNAVFGAISGSSPAAVATFGKIVYEPLAKVQGPALSMGIITSSGALSTIIPPSITLIIFGIATESSVTSLFMAGFLPGILLVAVVSMYLVWRCSKNARLGLYESGVQERPTRTEIGAAFIRAIPVLILPVLILGGIYSGTFTPTEAGAVAAIYSFVVAFFFLKDIPPRQLPRQLADACRVTSQIFILIAVSTCFAQVATMAQLPSMITASFSEFDKITFLLMLNVLLLIVGCFFDTGAAILILAPLLMPAAYSLGIDPIHLGIIFTVNLSIGMFTPPFGLNIFVAQSVLKKPMGEISAALLPYIVLYVAGLLVITYVPEISLVLPRLLL
ncbi:MAG: TRAP transporter large permease [Clostridiales Family XIII bacterium]|jgi:C4-dicarboxylate transporter DctM subunit|nr:TRAP transporter large permease [Clostridiales Family XIII bacterium]